MKGILEKIKESNHKEFKFGKLTMNMIKDYIKENLTPKKNDKIVAKVL
jgi:oligoribonuclease (3'-5' exoribonuclease)